MTDRHEMSLIYGAIFLVTETVDCLDSTKGKKRKKTKERKKRLIKSSRDTRSVVRHGIVLLRVLSVSETGVPQISDSKD